MGVDTAIGDGAFTVLVEALQEAALVATLSGPGPFTVFAPTDTAFAVLLQSLNVTKGELLARADLARILQYHVINGQVLSSDLVATQDVTTLSGDDLTVTNDGTTVMAGPATVERADVLSGNGVIHAIDAVLLPPPPSIVDTAIGDGAFTVLVEALQEAALVATLSGPGPFTVFAPTDTAFAVLLQNLNVTKGELLARADLARILQYHVINGQVLSSDLEATQDVTTLSGDDLTVTNDGTTVMTGPATVERADVLSGNGVIHAIDAVLLPPAESRSEYV